MKLIDLLVQELPKRGGWPDGAHECFVHCETSTFAYFYDSVGAGVERTEPIPIEGIEYEGGEDGFGITRDQYEAALAASQKLTWNGDGLPPVGCECEWRDKNVGWIPVTIKYISEQIVVMESPTIFCGVHELTEIAKDIICDKPQFRPLRTEADKKREAILDAIYGALTRAEREHNRSDEAEAVYEAIAAGKIPGVKLED